MFFGDISASISGLLYAAFGLIIVWAVCLELHYREEKAREDRENETK